MCQCNVSFDEPERKQDQLFLLCLLIQIDFHRKLVVGNETGQFEVSCTFHSDQQQLIGLRVFYQIVTLDKVFGCVVARSVTKSVYFWVQQFFFGLEDL